MNSPFKFLDSYTSEDLEILPGFEKVFNKLGLYSYYTISPLQGLISFILSSSHWTISNAQVYCAYSALKEALHSSLREHYNVLIYNIVQYNNRQATSALKGPHITKQDNVLRDALKVLINPERA
jgi:hypothetical protein